MPKQRKKMSYLFSWECYQKKKRISLGEKKMKPIETVIKTRAKKNNKVKFSK